MVIFNLVLLPYWASFAEAAHQKDRKWIQNNVKKLILFVVWILMDLHY